MKEEHLVQLATCANDITLALEKIWQELGLNQEEEEQKLMKEAHTFFENKYQQFQQTILDYQQKILTLQEEIQHTRQILHQDMSSHQFYDTGAKTLMDKMTALQVECDCLFKIRDERIKKLTELQQELVHITTKLGEAVEVDYLDVRNDLALERIDLFQAQISLKRQELLNRSQAIEKVSKECCDLIQLLQLKEEELEEIDHHLFFFQQFSGVNHNVSSNFIFSIENIEKISLRIQNLQNLKIKRQEILDKKKKKIEILWKKLQISLQEQHFFLQKKIYPSLGQDVMDLYEIELQRLIELKKERLEELIQEIQKKIQNKLIQINQYTDNTTKFNTTSKIDTSTVSTCNSEIQTEQELILLEEKLDFLEKKWQKMEFIVKYISMREQILQERQEYEESLKDSSRLMSRSKEVGRLLRAQEKIQAKIKKDLPKVTSLLEEKINTWENEFSMGFFYQGQRYLETMDQQEKNYKLQKELQKLQKQQAKNEKLQKNTSGMSEKNQKKIFSSSTMNSTFNRSNNQLTPSTINNNNNNNNMTGSNNNKNPTKQNTNNLKSSNPLENLCSFSRDFSSAASIKSISTTSSSDDANNQLLH